MIDNEIHEACRAVRRASDELHDSVTNLLKVLCPRAIHVNDTCLSVRAKNVLTNEGISMLHELCDVAEADLYKWRNVGRVTVEEIKEVLMVYGLSLKDKA